MPQFKKHILSNGLRVILVPQEGVAATVLVLVEAGSKYETKKINGLSHFLEHLCFKGTVRRPQASEISTELDSLGAEYNAFTSQEFTGYWAKAHYKQLDKLLDLVSDLYLNPIFNEKELEKEKGVVIEELNMYEDTPMRKVSDLFMEVLYGDQPAGWTIGGTKEVIRALTRNDVVSYRKAHYVSNATTVVVAGNFPEKKILRDVENIFGGVSRGKKSEKLSVKEPQSRPSILLRHKDSDQTHVIMGVRAFDMYDDRRFALNLLSDILGGGMSSRLFRKVRDELGAAYYVRSFIELYTDHGFWAVKAGLDNKRANEVIAVILEELRKLASEKVGAEELKKSKSHLTGSLMLGLETSDELANYYGSQEIFHEKIVGPEELSKQISAVTSEDIQRVAKQLVIGKYLNLAVIGPFKDKKPFEKLLKL